LFWQSILEDAESRGRVPDIVKHARKRYPENQSLKLAEENQLHLAVWAQDIPDQDWQGPTSGTSLEKLMGRVSTLRPIWFLEKGLSKARSVCRVVLADGSRGTGFLPKNNLLITNHHVLPDEAAARGATIEFNYQQTLEGRDAPVESCTLAPDQGFATSPAADKGGDDWTAVRVQGVADDRWGALPLVPANPHVEDEVIIIQHAGGGPKQIALSHNVVAYVSNRRLQYLTDTLEGSSGSPDFDVTWSVVALHFGGGNIREPGTSHVVFRNQGTLINRVIDGLQQAGLL
jgi:V8-like Glu-specific endopeptidase